MNLEKQLRRYVGRAIADYGMIGPNEKILVGLSGGKDSWTLLDILHRLQACAPVSFELAALHINYAASPGPQHHNLETFIKEHYPNVSFTVVNGDIESIIADKTPEGDFKCVLCSRLRRGLIYTWAKRLGATRIALGHHREDANETLLMSMFYNGTLKSMPARLLSDDKAHVLVRPLIYTPEQLIIAWAKQQDYPIIDCPCNHDQSSNRLKIKKLLNSLEQEIPQIKNSLLAAQTNVVASHLLDRALFDFKQHT